MTIYCDKCGTRHDSSVCPSCSGLGKSRPMTAPDVSADVRARFEALALREGFALDRADDGEYHGLSARYAWRGFQMALGEKMTLDEVSAALRNNADGLLRMDEHPILANRLRKLADAIDAHLTQPAQAVDVGAIREVIAELSNPSVLHAPYVTRCADKLTAALPNADGKEGKS